MLISSFQLLTLFNWERSPWKNWSLILPKKRVLVGDGNVYHSSQLRIENAGLEIVKTFFWKKNEQFLQQWNEQTYLHLIILTSFSAICICYLHLFFKEQWKKDEANSSQTQHPVFKRLQRYIGGLKLTVLLSFDCQTNFQHSPSSVWFHFCGA